MKLKKGLIIGTILGATILLGGKFVYDNFLAEDDFPYSMTYISIQGNENEQAQVDLINKELKDNNVKADETDINILAVDDNLNTVISESEYNKLAKVKKLEEVKVNDNEAVIIPRYDGIKNFTYMDELKDLKEYKIADNTVKVIDIVNKKILPTGLMKSILIISDNQYAQLEKDQGNKKVQVKGYDFEDNQNAEDAVKVIKKNKLFENNNKKRDFYLISKYYFKE